MRSQLDRPLRYSDFDLFFAQKKTVLMRAESEYGRIVSGNVSVAAMPSAMLLTTQNFSGLEKVFLSPDSVNFTEAEPIDSTLLVALGEISGISQAFLNVSGDKPNLQVNHKPFFSGAEFESESPSLMPALPAQTPTQSGAASRHTNSFIDESSFSFLKIKPATEFATVMQSRFGSELLDVSYFEGLNSKRLSLNQAENLSIQSNSNSTLTETGSRFSSPFMFSQQRTKLEVVKSSEDKDLADTLMSATSTNLSVKYLPHIEYIIYTGLKDATLTGNASNNTLIGSTGNDTLIGAGGDDQLLGGGGDDVFVFRSRDGFNQVLDFAEGDRLHFLNAGHISKIAINDSVSSQQVSFGDTIVELVGASGLTLNPDWILLSL